MVQLAAIVLAAACLATQPQVPDTLHTAHVAADRSAATAATVPLQSLGAAELELRGITQLSEAVRGLAGVSVKDYGGVGGLKTVSVRGLGAQHTAVVMDGVSMGNAQNGQVDLSRFNLEGLEQISVATGGSDVIFCSPRLLNAAGILELKSSRPDFSGFGQAGPDSLRRFRSAVLVRAGSFNTWDGYLRWQQRISSRWSADAWGKVTSTDGNYPFTLQNGNERFSLTRENSDLRSISSQASLYGNIGAGELSARVRWFGSERGLPGSVVLYTQNPTERLWDKELNTTVNYNWEKGRWKARTMLEYDWNWNRYLDTNAAYVSPEDDRYSQHEWTAEGIAQYSPAERIQVVLSENFMVNKLDSSIPECVFPLRLSSVTGLSAQYHGERLTATASLQGTFVHEKSLLTDGSGTVAPDRARLCPSISTSYLLAEGLRLRASWRDGFRNPTLNDLYYARVGNSSLRPELAHQFNAGCTWWHSVGRNSFTVTADAYYNRVKDKIVATPTMFIWKMRNVGEVEMAGAELTAAWTWHPTQWLTMRLSGNYSFLYAVDISDQSSKTWRNQIAYTPRHSGNATAAFETPWINISWTMNAVGKRYVLDQNIASNAVAAYADHSISVNHSFAFRRWSLLVSAEALNIGNVNYEVVKWYPMAGRNYRITIKITL